MAGFDAIVVGGGHNGLVAAAVLARAGRRVVVLERRDRVGGACVTEERWPGYRVSRAAYVAGLLRPTVMRELGLAARGLRLLPRTPSSYTPLPDRPGLLMGGSMAATQSGIAAFSERDAAAYPRYEALLDRTAQVLEPLLDAPAFDPAAPRWDGLRPLVRVLPRVLAMRRDLPRALGLLLGAARPALEEWFESEPLRGTLATDAIIGAWASPASPGTGYVLFHHVMGETGGARGVWAYVEGGMGRLSDAIADAARSAGAELRCEAPVARISVDDGRARGVVLEDGTALDAPLVLSGADPHQTFRVLVGDAALDPSFARAVDAIDYRSPVVKINLALDRLPAFAHASGVSPGPEHQGTIHAGARTLDELDASFAAASEGRLPERPMVELTLPSAVDPTLAPEGHAVASMFVQHAPCDWDDARWSTGRDTIAQRAFAMIEEVAPGFRDSIVHHEVLAPPDLERIFGLRGGNIFHGAMTPDRLAFLRPVPGAGGYATPIAGLYLCGAAAHPGGGVMGACGWNAAQRVLRDTAR